MNSQLKGTILALTGASLWGILGIFIRNLNAFGLNGMDIAFFRCLLSGIGFMLFNAVTNPEVLKVNFKSIVGYSPYLKRLPRGTERLTGGSREVKHLNG